MQHLEANTQLQSGKYKIVSALGQGGFGITYLAIQSGLERKVAIKEFFMKELCERDESTSHVTLGTQSSRATVERFREKFLKEARNLAKLNHHNIVRIIDVFEENGTAYYVMEYAVNGSLADKVKNEGYLSEPVATRYIKQVAEALDYIHQQKMNHLDVKPANIMLNEKNESVLIDFGLSKQYDAITGNQTSTTPVGISDGYAPMEQYKPGGVGEFSPETDIYSLGATFFKLLTGITPPSASDVNEDGVPVDDLKAKGVSQAAIDAICQAMEGRKKDRMKSIGSFVAALHSSANVEPKAPEVLAEVTPQPKPEVEDEATQIIKEPEKAPEVQPSTEVKPQPQPVPPTPHVPTYKPKGLWEKVSTSLRKHKTQAAVLGISLVISMILYFFYGPIGLLIEDTFGYGFLSIIWRQLSAFIRWTLLHTSVIIVLFSAFRVKKKLWSLIPIFFLLQIGSISIGDNTYTEPSYVLFSVGNFLVIIVLIVAILNTKNAFARLACILFSFLIIKNLLYLPVVCTIGLPDFWWEYDWFLYLTRFIAIFILFVMALRKQLNKVEKSG